jgi:hypothetical protein
VWKPRLTDIGRFHQPAEPNHRSIARGQQDQREDVVAPEEHRNQSNHPRTGEGVFYPTITIDAFPQIRNVALKADQHGEMSDGRHPREPAGGGDKRQVAAHNELLLGVSTWPDCKQSGQRQLKFAQSSVSLTQRQGCSGLDQMEQSTSQIVPEKLGFLLQPQFFFNAVVG